MARKQEEAAQQREKTVGWQGFTMTVPETWDLTGFSGTETEGYLRVDDSEEQGIEIKWATESARAKQEPDPVLRRETYFGTLEKTARKKKLPLTVKEIESPAFVEREDRNAVGFQWTGDRKAIGAVWYCRTCRRVVIAQVIGDTTGRGLTATAEKLLRSVQCHSEDPEWQVWALYDLYTEVPTSYTLLSQQLMNVYLRLTFAHRESKAARLSIEQWALANVARKDEFLDVWLSLNSKAEMREARYEAEESTVQEHPALHLVGGPAIGMPMVQVARQVTRFQRPATKFSALAWECEPSNKVYLIQAMRPGRVPDPVKEVAMRTPCHLETGSGSGSEGGNE
ncbi:MAG: hypothetical protein OHK0029_03740 [Armatimonadaceae bacterium]